MSSIGFIECILQTEQIWMIDTHLESNFLL
jgi:hypothetical protein